MDKDDVVSNQFDTSKKLVDTMIDVFQTKYKLTEEQSVRIAFLIIQLKQGYTLTIFDDNLSMFDTSLCTIFLLPKDKYKGFDDLEFHVSIEKLSQLQFSKPHKSTVKFSQFIDIIFEYCKTRDMTLHYDINWKEEV